MNDPEHLTLDECAHRLGLRRGRLRRAIRDGDFPDPVGPDTDEPRWREVDVLRWAAASSPDLATRIPMRYWPEATEPAAYLGASERGEDAVLMMWQVGPGQVAVLWNTVDPIMVSLPDLVRRVDGATVLVNVQPDFGVDGPGVQAVNRATPEETYELGWRDLSRVLGQPVPYWPFPLRIAELICAWKPGAEPVIAPARPNLDTGTLLRLAAVFDSEHHTHRTLLNLARVTQSRNTASAQQDLDILRETISRGSRPEVPTAIAAVPMPVPDADHEDLNPMVRRAGWLEVLSRADTLSVQCVHEALTWDGGKDFPFSNPEEVDPRQGPGAEWAQRLKLAVQR